MKTEWTEELDAQLKLHLALRKSQNEIAREMGLPYRAITARLRHLRTQKPVKPNPVCTDAPNQDLVQYWRKRARELESALVEARQSKTAEEVLTERVLEMAPKSYSPVPGSFHKLPKEKHGTPQSAVALFSDTHIGAVVSPGQTLGLGNYNFEIFLRRLRRFERSIASIIRDHTTTEVPEIVIPILGDMLDGALQHSAESGQVNTMLAQFYQGGHAIAQFLRNLATVAPLRLYGVVGNHPRWQNQHKMPSKNRNSNFDMMLYLYVQALTRDLPDVKWTLDWQPFSTFEVQGFGFYCGHGENLRGGDRILGLPAHSMGRMVSTTTQLFARAGRDTPNYFCLGHLHRPIQIPHAKGEVIINGAFPGIDNFALSEYFNSSYPSQRFFLMHPKFGKSAEYNLRLDLGDTEEHGYELPTQFACQ